MFYLAFSDIDLADASAKFKNTKLSWSHYLILMRIKNPSERNFYEIEENKIIDKAN